VSNEIRCSCGDTPVDSRDDDQAVGVEPIEGLDMSEFICRCSVDDGGLGLDTHKCAHETRPSVANGEDVHGASCAHGPYHLTLAENRMKKQLERSTEFVGWVGVVLILVAYALLSADVLNQDRVAYHILNLTGGIGIIIDAVADKNYQPAALNVVWIMIALYAITRIVV
jgi:hypothetical protein